MTNLANFDNGRSLVDEWMEQERNGVRFPVPFDDAWKLAGYSHKGNAMRKLKSKRALLIEGEDYVIENGRFLKSDESRLSGRSADIVLLTTNCLKRFCQLAETVQGDQFRRYFIDREEKWKLVEKHHPQVAAETEDRQRKEQSEILDKQIILAQIQRDSEQAIATQKQCDERMLNFRNLVVQTSPDYIQQRILGYTEVKTVEYRDRIVNQDGEVIDPGDTLTQDSICRKLGILNGRGNPDKRRLKLYLSELGNEHFVERIIPNSVRQLKASSLPVLQEIYDRSRNLHLGENFFDGE